MLQENREIAQQGYDAFARRDFDAALALMDPPEAAGLSE
jgi:hypothetical protein